MLVFDLLIAIAYFAIPAELVYCLTRYPFPIRAKPAIVGCLFVTFITVCGECPHLTISLASAPYEITKTADVVRGASCCLCLMRDLYLQL